MKNISLFSFTLCLMVSNVCLGKMPKIIQEMVDMVQEKTENLKNPFRRKITLVLPGGREIVAYKKDTIENMFKKCRKVGACNESEKYNVTFWSTILQVEENSKDVKQRVLDLAPNATRAYIKPRGRNLAAPVTPSVKVEEPAPFKVEEKAPINVPVAPAPTQVEEVKLEEPKSALTPQLADISGQPEKRSFIRDNGITIGSGILAIALVIAYNLIPSPTRPSSKAPKK